MLVVAYTFGSCLCDYVVLLLCGFRTAVYAWTLRCVLPTVYMESVGRRWRTLHKVVGYGKKAMGRCISQLKMLLFSAKTIMRVWGNVELCCLLYDIYISVHHTLIAWGWFLRSHPQTTGMCWRHMHTCRHHSMDLCWHYTMEPELAVPARPLRGVN